MISIETSASQEAGGFYYKILLWNFKYYRLQIKKVSYWSKNIKSTKKLYF